MSTVHELNTATHRGKVLDPNHQHEVADEFEHRLRSSIIGQEAGVSAMAKSVINGLFPDPFSEPNKPRGTLLFLGPTGVGKTEVAKKTARILHDEPKLVRVDCHGLQASHEIATLIGSPPGYVDRDVTPRLHQRFIDAQTSKKCNLTILLFDEIEKASSRLFNLLLGAMDDGVITLNDNSETSFKNCVFVFTSNIGAKDMRDLVSSGVGFRSGGSGPEKTDKQIQNAAIKAAEAFFPPEFFNRFSEVVVFNPLQTDHYQKILNLELAALQSRINQSTNPFPLIFTDAAKQFILKKGIMPKYGARPLKGQIQELVTLPLKRIFHTRQLKLGEEILIDWQTGRECLTFYSRPSALQLLLDDKDDKPQRQGNKKEEILIAGEFIPNNAKVGKSSSGRAFKLQKGMEFLGYAQENIPQGGAVKVR